MKHSAQLDLFNLWMSDHGRIVHHVAQGFASASDRDDLAQELMLALWHAIPAFKGGSKVSTYIYGVVHHAALTWRRSQNNYQRRVDRFESETKPESTGTPPPRTREAEMLTHVYAYIRLLPPLDRSLLLLHLDAVSYADIAALHGLTESNVGTRLSRLKQKLSESLKSLTHELR